jgi:hypothetical protein
MAKKLKLEFGVLKNLILSQNRLPDDTEVVVMVNGAFEIATVGFVKDLKGQPVMTIIPTGHGRRQAIHGDPMIVGNPLPKRSR